MIALAPSRLTIQPAAFMMDVALLGPPTITWGGHPLELTRRQSRALLYRIAASPHALSRDHLCFLLWPDTPDATARRNLTVLLSHLRRTLPSPTMLMTGDDVIGLDHQAVWSDIWAFADALAATSYEPQPDQLRRAVELYRGAFLDGFTLPTSPEFEDWAAQERQTWERRYLETLATLTELYTAQGEYQSAIETAQQYLATDDLAEAMHRQLITLYAASGDRAAALRQFERCIVALERELGVSPLPETRAVYEAVRDGAVPLAAVVSKGTSRLAPEVRSDARYALPVPASSLIGREREVALATTALQQSGVRLLTLIGAGGSGKTRLALQIASELRDTFSQGVVFVPLAPLRDPATVIGAIARACGVQQTGAGLLTDMVHAYLRERRMLLVLDNFEHLLAAAPIVADLLAVAPHLRVLVTSQSVLNVQGEHIFPVLPLPIPDVAQLPPVDKLAQQPSVALLLARTRALKPDFQLTPDNAADVAAICARLDGLPLAIELAAARLKLLSPQALLRRLDHRLALLTDGPRDLYPRQRTLRATIDWSYGLLDPHEQLLFEHLAVFAGRWTLEAAEAVCGEAIHETILNGITSLVDKNLVQQETGPDGEPRFWMLETLREYAMDRLQMRGMVDSATQAHAEYFCHFAEHAALHLHGPEQIAWLARLSDAHTNLLAALNWACTHPDSETRLRLVNALGRYWIARGCPGEGRRWIGKALDLSPQPSVHSARAHAHAAELAIYQGDYAAACVHAQECTIIWQALGEQREFALALLLLSGAMFLNGNPTLGIQLAQQAEALIAELDDPEGHAQLHWCRGRDARHRGDAGVARQELETSLAYYRACGDLLVVTHILLDLGPVNLALGDPATAQTRLLEALALARSIGNCPTIALALNSLGEVARYQYDYHQAASYYTESLCILQNIGSRADVPRLIHNLGYVALHTGDVARAESLFRESLDQFRAARVERGIPEALAGLASVAAVQEQPLKAARLWGAAEARRESGNWMMWPADQQDYTRYLALAGAASDAPAFQSAWQAGRSLADEQTLEYTSEDVKILFQAG